MRNLFSAEKIIVVVLWLGACLYYFLRLSPYIYSPEIAHIILASISSADLSFVPAPVFSALSQVFAVFAGGNPFALSISIHVLAVVACATALVFLFLAVVALARVFVMRLGAAYANHTNLLVYGTALTATLSCMFSSSFISIATSAQPISLSVLILCVLLWIAAQRYSATARANKLILLACLLVGISTGLHPLVILCLPACAILYVLGMQNCSRNQKLNMIGVSFLGTILLYILSFILIPAGLSSVEVLFVNTFSFAQFSGFLFGLLFLPLVFAGLAYYFYRKHNQKLYFIFAGALLFSIGYSFHAYSFSRHQSNTPLENFFAHHHAYTGIEGVAHEKPSVWYGKYYTAIPISIRYQTNYTLFENGKYVRYQSRQKPVYSSGFKTIFPRMWSSQAHHVAAYKTWADSKDGENAKTLYEFGATHYVPTFRQNIRFFIRYQLGHTYMRYFLWNFAGRQNDVLGQGEPHKGNWMSGLPIIDSARLGPQDALPTFLRQNTARAVYFALPLVLGILGFVILLQKWKALAFALSVLFVCGGIGIAILINAPPSIIVEFDTVFIASYIAFCVCIGFGLLFLLEYIRQFSKHALALSGGIVFLSLGILLLSNRNIHASAQNNAIHIQSLHTLESCSEYAILCVENEREALPLLAVQKLFSIRNDVTILVRSLLHNPAYLSRITEQPSPEKTVLLTIPRERYAGTQLSEIPVLVQSPLAHLRYPMSDILGFIAADSIMFKAKITEDVYIDYIPVPHAVIPVSHIPAPISLTQQIQSFIPISFIDTQYAFSWEDTVLAKNQLLTIDIIASNISRRPLYVSEKVARQWLFDLQSYSFFNGFVYRIYPARAIRNTGADAQFLTSVMHTNLVQKRIFESYTPHNSCSHTETLGAYRDKLMQLALAQIHENRFEYAAEALNYAMYVAPCAVTPCTKQGIDMAYMYELLGMQTHAQSMYSQTIADVQEQLFYYMTVPTRFRAFISAEVFETIEIATELFELLLRDEYRSHAYSVAASTSVFFEHFFDFISQVRVTNQYEFMRINQWIVGLSQKNQEIVFWYNKMKLYLESQ